MDMEQTPTLAHMQQILQRWQETSDPRQVFLSVYSMMTSNMLSAAAEHQFQDRQWVESLVDHFAKYYFDALEAYERDPESAPLVWQLAHEASRDPSTQAIQILLLGVNAHINYDLVLVLEEILSPEWGSLDENRRVQRYADHCRVNEVIQQTIDATQDQVLEPRMPLMALVDVLMGPLDEMIVARMITEWREEVWRNAARLLSCMEPVEHDLILKQIEEDAVRLAKLISHRL